MLTKEEHRIARNTAFLYVRMLLTVFVSLYTSRVVLETLGVNNFGIYNLLGGIVAVFAFLNGTMSAATMRFLNYEMGLGSEGKLKRTFDTSLTLHILIALVLLVLGETVGLWFVNNKLVIAPERMVVANWTYQFSILASIVNILQIPFTASIMAHERMDAYAYISLAFTFLKLAVAVSLAYIVALDTLVTYAVLIFLITLIIAFAYFIYCRRNFDECRGKISPDKTFFKAFLKYSGWDIYGNLAHISRIQGANVILNNFGGTVLNAASSLSATVSSVITQFSVTVLSAFRPQIVKQYAAANYPFMVKLLNNCCKFSYLLLILFVVPCIVEMPYVLSIWLKEVPIYTVPFCQICLIAAIGELIKMVVDSGIHATGRIMRLSLITGTMLLIELPAMYFLLRYTGNPNVCFMLHAGWLVFIILTDCFILKYQMRQFPVMGFLFNGIFVPSLVFAASMAVALAIRFAMDQSFLRLLAVALASAMTTVVLSYCFCIDKETRHILIVKVKEKLHIS